MRLGWLLLLSSTVAVADDLDEAKRLYAEGKTAYDQQRWDQAIEAWEKSFALSKAPALHLNLAQAHRSRGGPGDIANACTEYREFVQTLGPDREQDRHLADSAIAELRCAEVAAPVKAPTVPVEPSHSNRKMAIAALGVGGGLLLVSGLYLGHHAGTLSDQVTRACEVSCDWAQQKSKDAAGHRDAKLGYTFDVIGLAAIAGAAVWSWVGIHEAAISPTSQGTGAVVSWRTSW